MLDLKETVNTRKLLFHVVHTMVDGENVLVCRSNDYQVRVNELALSEFEKLGTRVLMFNGFDAKWEATPPSIRLCEDYVVGEKGAFWGVLPPQDTVQLGNPVWVKGKFGSSNPQLHTIQAKLAQGECLIIAKQTVHVGGYSSE